MSPSQPGDMCPLNSARTLEEQSPMGPSIPQMGQCKPSWHFTSAHILGKAHERLLCPSLQLCNHTCLRGLGSTGRHSPHLQCLSGQTFQSRVTAPSYPTLYLGTPPTRSGEGSSLLLRSSCSSCLAKDASYDLCQP